MPAWRQTRPTAPGRYLVKPWLAANEREAVIETKPSGLVMTKIGEKTTSVPVDSMATTLWWAGPR